MITELLAGIILLSLTLALIVWYGYNRQSAIYGQMFKLLERERDEARHECSVYRGLVFPGYAKAEAFMTGAGSSPAVANLPRSSTGRASVIGAEKSAPNPGHARRRIPFKQFFKQQLAAMNTKQIRTDALASALATQKPQERIDATNR